MLYRIFGEGVKFHWAGTIELAQKVADNLKARYNTTPIIELIDEQSSEMFWDPGGSIFTDDEPVEFNLGDVTMSCWLQHWDIFKQKVLRLDTTDTSKYGNEFHKMHGYMHILCLSNSQKEALVKQVKQNSEKYDLMWQIVDERINNVHAELNRDGYLISDRGQRELQKQKEDPTEAAIPKERLN